MIDVISLRDKFEETNLAKTILENGKVWFNEHVGVYSGQGNDYFKINRAWHLFKELKGTSNTKEVANDD